MKRNPHLDLVFERKKTPAKRIRKAVIPVAGLGVRLLPATKSVSKAMIPVLDKPLVQYAVEEAVESGIEEIILVTRRGQSFLEGYFRSDPKLERYLEVRGRKREAAEICRLSHLAKISLVRQDRPRGLGHAIRCARTLVGNEPFAVLLPDVIIDARTPCMRQLIDCYRRNRGCIVAMREVEVSEVHRYGILGVEPLAAPNWKGKLFRVTRLAEKPGLEEAPSCYGIVGRYLLDPGIFSFIDQTKPDRRGEIELTDSLLLYSCRKPLYALKIDGTEYDLGDKLGFVKATLALALKNPDLGGPLRDYIASLRLNF